MFFRSLLFPNFSIWYYQLKFGNKGERFASPESFHPAVTGC